MMSIPYLITYISYNYVNNIRGIISEDLLDQFILDDVSEYIINNSFSTKFETINDIENFWERYGGYNVWDAYCIKNNNWINIKPSNNLILENICEMTKTVEMSNYEENEYIQEKFKESCEKNIEEKKDKNSIDDVFSDFLIDNDEYVNVDKDINIDWSNIYIKELEELEEIEELDDLKNNKNNNNN
jgi:hypothetical protein